MTTNQWIILLSQVLGAVAVTILLTISPRFRQNPLVFKYPRREGPVAVGVFAAAALISLLLYSGQVPLINTNPAGGFTNVQNLVIQLTVAALGLAVVLAALAYRRQPIRSAGWSRPLNMPSLQTGIALVLITLFLSGKITRLFDGISAEQGTALLFALGLALVEETIFRGYIQLRLAAWIGRWYGWLATAGMFTLWQLPRLIFLQPGQDLLLQLGLAAIQGLLLGWMMQKTNHVLAPALFRATTIWLSFLG